MKKFSKSNDEQNLWQYVGLAMELGGALLAPPIVGWVLGTLLDKWWQTGPFFTIVLLICGVLAGLKTLYKTIMKIK